MATVTQQLTVLATMAVPEPRLRSLVATVVKNQQVRFAVFQMMKRPVQPALSLVHLPFQLLTPLSVMQCLLCRRTLDDTRYVQCPSTPMHKFCFSCTQESIKKQAENSSDVYCPSGMKCLVVGSTTTPWAFMEQEISQILYPDSEEA